MIDPVLRLYKEEEEEEEEEELSDYALQSCIEKSSAKLFNFILFFFLGTTVR